MGGGRCGMTSLAKQSLDDHPTQERLLQHQQGTAPWPEIHQKQGCTQEHTLEAAAAPVGH